MLEVLRLKFSREEFGPNSKLWSKDRYSVSDLALPKAEKKGSLEAVGVPNILPQIFRR